MIPSTPTQPPPRTRGPRAPFREARSRRELRVDDRPSSLLDSARRRIKNNMLSIAQRLRLECDRVDLPSVEAMLTEFQARLGRLAVLQRTLSRGGRFEQADLAVFLRLVASGLSAASGHGFDEREPRSAGWTIDLPENTLVWIDDWCEVHQTSMGVATALDDVLPFVPKERRAMAQRALCAAAVLFPPAIFKWRSPSSRPPACGCPRTSRAGDVSARLRIADDGLALEITIAQGGLGLPRDFDRSRQSSMALQLASVLNQIIHENSPGSDRDVVFEVGFREELPSGASSAGRDANGPLPAHEHRL